MSERLKFVAAALEGRESMTDLCARFGISRKSGYKLLQRYESEGPGGLRDRSRAPRSHPNRTPPEIERAILSVRKGRPTWGSKKILTVLGRELPEDALPARSTVDQILKRAGVVPTRKRGRGRREPRAAPVVDARAPNDAWSIDYKGWFRVGDGTRCDPLTVNDVYSRASLECRAMVSPKLDDVQRQLEQVFWQVGLPKRMLSDNGPPFGARGIGGLSRLGVWLLKLDVQPVFIQPGHPEQNGRHERFHKTLKAETASPPRATVRAQQSAFDRFTTSYNKERPHEALEMRTPSELYESSPRPMPRRVPEFEYDELFEVRRVRTDGTIRWEGEHIFVGSAMSGDRVGIKPVGERDWHLYLGRMRLGVLHEESGLVLPMTEGAEDEAGVTHVPGHVDQP